MSDAVQVALFFFGLLFLIFLVLTFKFPDEVRYLISRIRGMEISKDRVAIDFAVESAKKSFEQKGAEVPPESAIRTQLIPLIAQRRILWVDDKPSNNVFEVETLLGLGYQVDLAMTNEHAARLTSTFAYDLILSDIERPSPEPSHAGLELPKVLLQSLPDLPPLIYYTGQATDPQTPDGYPVTDEPSALFRAIGQAMS